MKVWKAIKSISSEMFEKKVQKSTKNNSIVRW